jgi:hypothetical protein
MLPANLITFEQAAAQLGISESALDDLIDAGTLTTQPYLGDIYLLADQVTAQATANPPAPTPGPERKPPDDAKLRRIQLLLDTGVREVRAAQAAELLEIRTSAMARLAQEGRVNAEKRGAHYWYVLEDVLTYAGLQNVWASKSGAWTPYGKQEAVEPGHDMLKLAPASKRRIPPAQQSTTEDDYPLTAQQTADILGVSIVRVHRMVQLGQLHVEKSKRTAHHPDALGRPIVRSVSTFSAREVYAVADVRDQKKLRAGATPTTWKNRMVKPFIRTTIEPPQNDRLITRAEAAGYLGVPVQRVSFLVAKGRLFGWQTHPGKPGCPLFLSERQVIRYGTDPDRVKRRAAAARREPRPPSPLGYETEHEIWLENTGVGEAARLAVKSNLDRQHGDFLNARQAAKLLRINVRTLHALRQRGRITGYQKPRRKVDGGGNKWWFYKREDVDALLLDGEYTRRRDKARTAKLRSLGRWIPETEATW